ncbi:UNVERIFIED_CONTAM: hypothetical protein K2H54_034315 [Gekko kuhli]
MPGLPAMEQEASTGLAVEDGSCSGLASIVGSDMGSGSSVGLAVEAKSCTNHTKLTRGISSDSRVRSLSSGDGVWETLVGLAAMMVGRNGAMVCTVTVKGSNTITWPDLMTLYHHDVTHTPLTV